METAAKEITFGIPGQLQAPEEVGAPALALMRAPQIIWINTRRLGAKEIAP